jgi:hypothetical protein
MNRFFRLGPPDSDEENAIYGDPAWEAQFGLAEWSETVKDSLPQILCSINPMHRRAGARSVDLRIILPSWNVADFVWTWQNECLVTGRVLRLLEAKGLTGFEPHAVGVDSVRGKRPTDSAESPMLWELKVIGSGGDARPESGIRLIKQCPGCGLVRYSSFTNGILVDETQWDGSDFFTVNGYPRYLLVTEAVRDAIVEHHLKNCALVRAEDLIWPEAVIRPEEV